MRNPDLPIEVLALIQAQTTPGQARLEVETSPRVTSMFGDATAVTWWRESYPGSGFLVEVTERMAEIARLSEEMASLARSCTNSADVAVMVATALELEAAVRLSRWSNV